MSIALRTDIILDVISAAEPSRAAAATREFESLSTASPGSSFSSHLGSATEQMATNRAAAEPLHRLNRTASAISPANRQDPKHAAAVASTAPPTDPSGALGALLVQKMIEQMMPKASSTTFGSGSAGSIWRSTLAEKLALAIAPSIFNAQSLKLPTDPASAGSTTAPAA